MRLMKNPNSRRGSLGRLYRSGRRLDRRGAERTPEPHLGSELDVGVRWFVTVVRYTRGSSTPQRLTGFSDLCVACVVDPRLAHLDGSPPSSSAGLIVVPWELCRKAIAYTSDSLYHILFTMWGKNRTVLTVEGPLTVCRALDINLWLVSHFNETAYTHYLPGSISKGLNGTDNKVARFSKPDYLEARASWLTNGSAWVLGGDEVLWLTWPQHQ